MSNFDFDDDPFFTEKAPVGFEEDFIKKLGARRYQEILQRMQLDQKSSFRMRDLAKILIGSSDVSRRDIVEVLQGYQPPQVPSPLMLELSQYKTPESLPAPLFRKLYLLLSSPFGERIFSKIDDKRIEQHLHDVMHFTISCLKYDPYWFAKQRMTAWLNNHQLNEHLYNERLSGFYAACEDIQVGQYIPAPNELFYRVAAHLITGDGQNGIIIVPATDDTPLEKVRVTSGSPSPPGGLDFLSYALTDMEPEIGKYGYESGLYYQPIIDEHIGHIDREIGYSIGGTIAQWRTAENPNNLSSLWLYKSPGVPQKVWEKFNQNVRSRTAPLNLYIYQAKGDIVDYAGDIPLGYMAPDNVNVSVFELRLPKINPHRYSFIEPDKVSIQEIEQTNIDQYLSKSSRTFVEKHRKRLGEMFVVPTLQMVKKVLKRFPRARINQVKGLDLESRKGPLESLEILHFENRD